MIMQHVQDPVMLQRSLLLTPLPVDMHAIPAHVSACVCTETRLALCMTVDDLDVEGMMRVTALILHYHIVNGSK